MTHNDKSEWGTALAVAHIAPNTGMVPVRSATLIAVAAEIERLRAAAQPAPAPSVDPEAWRIKQGARVFIVSAAEFTRTSYDYGEFTPLYATPQPAPAAVPADIQRDAERYRWLRSEDSTGRVAKFWKMACLDYALTLEPLDAAIDRAMAAAPAPATGGQHE